MLFFEIRKNRKLATRRSPMFEKNRFAKVFMYFGIAFWAAYLLFIGAMLPSAFQESFPGMEPYHILNKGLIIILFLDFLIRFMLPTPVQEIKPYLLLPVPKQRVILAFLAVFVHTFCPDKHYTFLRTDWCRGIPSRHLAHDCHEQLLEHADLRTQAR